MSIWSRIASVTFSASANDSTAKPRLVELSEKRKPKLVDESRTAIVGGWLVSLAKMGFSALINRVVRRGGVEWTVGRR